MLVEDLMTTHPVTVSPDSSVKEALELLDRHRVTLLPVVVEGRIRGVVSEADLIRDLVTHDPRTREIPDRAGLERPARVEDVMTADAVTVRADTDLAVAVALLTSTTVKSVPVVDGVGQVQGMLSRSDVVRCYARSDERIADEIVRALVSAGLADWLVEVHDGHAEISGGGAADLSETTLAFVLARTVPGVVDVQASDGSW